MESDEIAYHEAGHAVVAVWLGGELLHATVEPDRDDGPLRDGDVAIRWHHRGLSQRELLQREVLVCLAGPAAEIVYRGDVESFEDDSYSSNPAWAMDWHIADELSSRFLPSQPNRRQFLDQMVAKLLRLFDQPPFWNAISETADELSAHGTIEGEVVQEIVKRWIHD